MQTQKFIRELTNEKPKDALKKLNYTTVFEKNGNRMLIFANRYRADEDQMYRECNGLILEKDTFNIIAYPPPPLTLQYGYRFKEKIKKTLSEYNVYYANDGTSILLYYYLDQWIISTNKMYDASQVKPHGLQTTYIAAFTEVMANYPEFSFDKLDKNLTYNIIMHHIEFHPYGGDNSAQFIAAYTKTGEKQTPEIGISCPIIVNIEPNELFNSAFNALKAAKTSKTPPLFGYILEHKETGSRILLESSLLYNIRRRFYDNKVIQEIRDHNYNKLDFLILRAVTQNDRQFASLFPQYATHLKRAKKIVASTYIAIFQYYNVIESTTNEINVTKHVIELNKCFSIDMIKKCPTVINDYLASTIAFPLLYAAFTA